MKLRTLKSRPEEIKDGRGALHVIDGPTHIIEWPYPAVESIPNGGVEVRAEVQTKRFGDRSVDSERYTATVRAADNSPYAIMAALVEACGGIDEFRAAGAPGDQVILQISLRA